MKFGKLLRRTIEASHPQLRDKFLCYKALKKRLHGLQAQRPADAGAAEGGTGVDDGCGPASVSGRDAELPPQGTAACMRPTPVLAGAGAGGAAHQPGRVTPEEHAFIRTLNSELNKFNDYFMEKEEESVIHFKALEDRLAAAASASAPAADYQALGAAFAAAHGEMVLLLHWSSLNYAGLAKILKKHDKCTGLLLRSPYLRNVLRQPFYSTEVLTRLVAQAEVHFRAITQRLAGMRPGSAGAAAREGEPSPLLPLPLPPGEFDAEGDDGSMVRRTEAALRSWQALRNGVPLDEGADGEDDEDDSDGEDNTPSGRPLSGGRDRPPSHSPVPDEPPLPPAKRIKA